MSHNPRRTVKNTQRCVLITSGDGTALRAPRVLPASSNVYRYLGTAGKSLLFFPVPPIALVNAVSPLEIPAPTLPRTSFFLSNSVALAYPEDKPCETFVVIPYLTLTSFALLAAALSGRKV